MHLCRSGGIASGGVILDVQFRADFFRKPYFDHDGNLVACADEKGQLWRIDPQTKKTAILLDQFDGKLFNGPNDLWIAPSGGMYFTDPFYKRNYWQGRDKPDQAKQRVYYLKKGAKSPVVAEETLTQPNGIIGSPDGKQLFVADIGSKKTYQYEIAGDGALTNRKLFCEMGSDGMTRDTAGNLYLTGKGVTVFDKKGKKLGNIPIDKGWTANVTFGGPDMKTLFITAMDSVFTLQMAPFSPCQRRTSHQSTISTPPNEKPVDRNPRALISTRTTSLSRSSYISSCGRSGLGPVDVEELAARMVDALVGVGAEEVALALQQVGGEFFRAIAVVVGQRAAHAGSGHALQRGGGDDLAPLRLELVDLALEVRIEQQVGEFAVAFEGLGDLLQEDGADDAAAAENLGDFSEVERPVVFLLRLAHELEALGVGTDLRAIQRGVDGLDELLLVAGVVAVRTG